MENARCKIHANHNEYGIGSWDLGMGNADSIWYANLWGAWGMLAWGMQSARIMPTFQTTWIIPIVGMGNAGSNSYAKTSSGLGSLPILAWLLLQEGSAYWHGVCYQQLPCQKKSSIRVHFVLDISTKIWYNSRLDFWKWGACAENSFSKFFKISPIGIFFGGKGGMGSNFKYPKLKNFFFQNFRYFPY